MADPVSLMAISMATTAVGTGVSAYGAYRQGQAGKAMYDYQAATAAMNAKLAEQTAERERLIGESNAGRIGMDWSQKMGSTRALFGASGLDVNTGSKSLVSKSQQTSADYDMDMSRWNADWKSYYAKTRAAEATSQGRLYGMAGEDSARSGTTRMAGTLLAGAGSVAGKWYDWQRVGGDETGYSEDPGSYAQSSRGGGYGGARW